MPVLQKASFGYLLRHPVQLLLALLGIATGVAVIVAVDLANSSARTAFRLSMDAITGAATHQIVGGPGGIDDSLYVRLRAEHGVTRIAPVIAGFADGADATLQVLGIDPFAEQEFRSYTLAVDAGGTARVRKLLRGDGAVLVSDATASERGLADGASFELDIDGIEHRAVLAGLFPADDSDAGLRNLVITDISTAQGWYGMAGRLSRIDVRVENEAEAAQLRQLLPAGVQLLSAAGRTESVTQMSYAFTINLTAMSLLALLIGVFLIYNSVSFAVMQRRTLLSTLRALGLTRGGLHRLILGEALLLGAAGSALGLAAGVWLGETLLTLVSQSLNDLYFRSSVTDVAVSSRSLAKGVAAGVFATLVAAALPAIEAASYPPRLGMQRVSLEQRTGKLAGKLAVVGIGLAFCVVPLLQFSQQSLVAGLLSLFMLIFGIALCLPFLVRHLLGSLAALMGWLAGDLVRLAITGISSNLSRTGVAIVALSIAVSATVGVSVMVDSFRLSVIAWVDSSLQADLYVAPTRGTMRPQAARRITAMPGVEEVSSSRRVWLETPQGRIRLIALQMAQRSYAGIELLEQSGGDVWSRFDEQGALLVSESYAYRHGIRPADVLALPTYLGERAFQVGGIYRSYDAQADAIIMNRTIYDLFWDDSAVDSVGVYLAADTDAAAVGEAIRAIAPAGASWQVRSNSDLRELSLAIFDRTFLITNVLYWLAVCVAVVGILGAMLALQLERSRELATLRALGVTRLQLGSMVTLQSAVIGLLSGLAAIPLGLLMAVLLIDVINRRAFGWSMPTMVTGDALWSAILLATVAAIIAGLYPAWRAGRSQPALAMRED